MPTYLWLLKGACENLWFAECIRTARTEYFKCKSPTDFQGRIKYNAIYKLENETATMQQDTINEEVDGVLNYDITVEELNKNIEKLKKGKAAAEDGISNEFLIHSTTDTRQVILKVNK